jgi:hypothetical protein
MSKYAPEPFGYFKLEDLSYWTDCHEDDEGAIPLYELSDEFLRLHNDAIRQRDELLATGQAVVDRWDSPLWKDQPHTAEFINALRQAIASVKGGAA